MLASQETAHTNERYDGHISVVMKLLNLAVNLGEQGLLANSADGLRISILEMLRSYEAALKRSWKLSLTTNHCASIDEKSHRIESLRSALEKRVLQMNRRKGLIPTRRHDLPSFRLKRVEIFLRRCNHMNQSARAMKELNADLRRESQRYSV